MFQDKSEKDPSQGSVASMSSTEESVATTRLFRRQYKKEMDELDQSIRSIKSEVLLTMHETAKLAVLRSSRMEKQMQKAGRVHHAKKPESATRRNLRRQESAPARYLDSEHRTVSSDTQTEDISTCTTGTSTRLALKHDLEQTRMLLMMSKIQVHNQKQRSFHLGSKATVLRDDIEEDAMLPTAQVDHLSPTHPKTKKRTIRKKQRGTKEACQEQSTSLARAA